jgi:hypothetical protein
MLQSLPAEIIYCYERARLARNLAARAFNDRFKADFVAAERRWMALAQSYERQHQLSRFLAEFSRRRRAGPIVQMAHEQRVAFGPDEVMLMDTAFHVALEQLGLLDREDGMALMIARRIIEVAGKGERDPKRMASAAVDAP